MKKTGFLMLMLSAVALGFTSCGDDDGPDNGSEEKNVLATPTSLSVTADDTSATISWTSVANADTYVYSFNGGAEQSTTATSVTFNDLTPETTYTFSVKATKANSIYFEDSEYMSVAFTTAPKAVVVPVYHVATYADDWDKWYYEYNADWTPKHIYRLKSDGSVDREWNFAYDGTSLSVTGKNTYDITLNDAGYVEKLIDGSKTYEYTYDADGYLIQVMKDGSVIVNCKYENGNLMEWSKLKDGAEVWKIHTYDMAAANVSNCHAIYPEGIGASRWFVETGLFGKANANLHLTNQWDYSDTGSTFTFDLDENGAVLGEHKLYGTDTENYYYTYVYEN